MRGRSSEFFQARIEAFGDFAEDAVEDFVGELYGFVNSVAGGDDADVDLGGAGEADSGDDAGSEVDEGAVGAGDFDLRVPHGKSVSVA